MRSVLRSGKWLALLYLGLVILFASCLGPPSEDNPVTGGNDASTEVGAWKFTVDIDNAKVDVESAEGTGIVLNGHTVALTSPGCTWNGGTKQLDCLVKMTNQAIGYSMWNVRTRNNKSSNPSAMINSDYTWSGCPLSCTPAIFKNIDEPINESGLCFTESGDFYNYVNPNFNKEGCENWFRNSVASPWQFIHPRCGSVTIHQVFKNVPSGRYNFWTQLFADFYPEIPRSGNTILDPRWDGVQGGYAVVGEENHRTNWIQVVDLNEQATKPTGWMSWKLGSSQRSNVLADPVLGAGRYFAVEMSYEYPDRIENNPDVGTLGDLAHSYEYYDAFAFAIAWDDNVITEVAADGTTPGGTPVYAEVVPACQGYSYWYIDHKANKITKNVNHCEDMRYDVYSGAQFWDNYITNSTMPNYLSTTSWYAAFKTFGDLSGPPWVYYFMAPSQNSSIGYDYVSSVQVTADAPAQLGNRGLTHFDHTTGALVHEGADAAPDTYIGLAYFQVNPAATTGQGTFISTWQSSYGNATMLYTNGNTKNQWDHAQYCYDAKTKTYDLWAYCDPLNPWNSVDGGTDKGNPNLPAGYANDFPPNGLGGTQTRDAHICVQ